MRNFCFFHDESRALNNFVTGLRAGGGLELFYPVDAMFNATSIVFLIAAD